VLYLHVRSENAKMKAAEAAENEAAACNLSSSSLPHDKHLPCGFPCASGPLKRATERQRTVEKTREAAELEQTADNRLHRAAGVPYGIAVIKAWQTAHQREQPLTKRALGLTIICSAEGWEKGHRGFLEMGTNRQRTEGSGQWTPK